MSTTQSHDAPLALVIDDDEMVRMLVRQTLEITGILVTDAPDGEQGLARFEQLSPDIVLLDVLMPGMDGFEVCAQIRGMPSGQRMSVPDAGSHSAQARTGGIGSDPEGAAARSSAPKKRTARRAARCPRARRGPAPRLGEETLPFIPR